MIIRQTCVHIAMMSGILLLVGCVFLGNEYEPQGVQFESAPEKALAGSYSDIGSNGSIKPHPESLYKLSQEQQEPQSQTTGEIILGGPAEIPDMSSLKIKKTGKPGGNRAGSDSVFGSNSTGSSGGASGAGGQ
jgi:hypothetical protein